MVMDNVCPFRFHVLLEVSLGMEIVRVIFGSERDWINSVSDRVVGIVVVSSSLVALSVVAVAVAIVAGGGRGTACPGVTGNAIVAAGTGSGMCGGRWSGNPV